MYLDEWLQQMGTPPGDVFGIETAKDGEYTLTPTTITDEKLVNLLLGDQRSSNLFQDYQSQLQFEVNMFEAYEKRGDTRRSDLIAERLSAASENLIKQE